MSYLEFDKAQIPYDDLVALKESWRHRGILASDAFLALISMVARFAKANNIPIEETCQTIRILFDDLLPPHEKPS